MHLKNFRKKIITACGYLEAYISILIIIAIAAFSINIIIDIAKIVPAFFTNEDSFFVEQFLGRSLELVIAIEFVKMIANNTPGSTIEVLIFAIARSIIVSHGTPLHQLFFGVGAIAVLFGVRKWAHKYDRNVVAAGEKSNAEANTSRIATHGKIVDADILVSKLNSIIHENIPARTRDTLGQLLFSCLKNTKGSVFVGDQLEIEGVRLIVHNMEKNMIREVEIISEHIEFYDEKSNRKSEKRENRNDLDISN